MTEKLHHCKSSEEGYMECQEYKNGNLRFDPDKPGEAAVRVNFCPLCGYEAKNKIEYENDSINTNTSSS